MPIIGGADYPMTPVTQPASGYRQCWDPYGTYMGMRNLAGYVTGHPLSNRSARCITNASRLRNGLARCITSVSGYVTGRPVAQPIYFGYLRMQFFSIELLDLLHNYM